MWLQINGGVYVRVRAGINRTKIAVFFFKKSMSFWGVTGEISNRRTQRDTHVMLTNTMSRVKTHTWRKALGREVAMIYYQFREIGWQVIGGSA
jgi:hypothetical protein